MHVCMHGFHYLASGNHKRLSLLCCSRTAFLIFQEMVLSLCCLLLGIVNQNNSRSKIIVYCIGLWSKEPLSSKVKSAKCAIRENFIASKITRYTVYWIYYTYIHVLIFYNTLIVRHYKYKTAEGLALQCSTVHIQF